jgi:phage-related protein
MKLTVHLFQTPGGSNPVGQYFESLQEDEAARVYAVLAEVQRIGLKGPLVQVRQIRGKLWELKLGMHRVFYVLITGPVMVLLHGCKKQSQKARQKDVDVALSRMKQVLDSE